MGIELPLFTACVARMNAPEVNLAAYGSLVFPIALVIEAPIMMLLAAATALASDRESWARVRGFMHLFLNGNRNGAHFGDGTWFYDPTQARVSEIRAVTLDHEGNLIITEHDGGFVRKVQFLPFQP